MLSAEFGVGPEILNDTGNYDSDSFFHSGSIEEMLVTIEAAACGTSTPLTNSVPTVDAGSDYIIPANTSFKLA